VLDFISYGSRLLFQNKSIVVDKSSREAFVKLPALLTIVQMIQIAITLILILYAWMRVTQIHVKDPGSVKEYAYR
jgi:hypothetical protein